MSDLRNETSMGGYIQDYWCSMGAKRRLGVLILFISFILFILSIGLLVDWFVAGLVFSVFGFSGIATIGFMLVMED